MQHEQAVLEMGSPAEPRSAIRFRGRPIFFFIFSFSLMGDAGEQSGSPRSLSFASCFAACSLLRRFASSRARCFARFTSISSAVRLRFAFFTISHEPQPHNFAAPLLCCARARRIAARAPRAAAERTGRSARAARFTVEQRQELEKSWRRAQKSNMSSGSPNYDKVKFWKSDCSSSNCVFLILAIFLCKVALKTIAVGFVSSRCFGCTDFHRDWTCFR